MSHAKCTQNAHLRALELEFRTLDLKFRTFGLRIRVTWLRNVLRCAQNVHMCSYIRPSPVQVSFLGLGAWNLKTLELRTSSHVA